MTTGYDCPDLLNLGLFRPIFSPTDFIQIKGRGTRKHDFREQLFDETIRESVKKPKKSSFKLFDFFANCEYFEKEFKYDEVRKLPKPKTGGKEGGGEGPVVTSGIYEHLGDNSRAEDIFTSAIVRNPDSDGGYLSLALLQLRENKLADAKLTLLKAKEHTPGSGKILWGLGLASALEGNTSEASNQLEHAVELLPEWPGSYSTLGVFYFETGQIEKAREVLNRFKNSNTGGGLDINRIEQVLAQAPGTAQSPSDPLNPDERARLLQLALFLADKTL